MTSGQPQVDLRALADGYLTALLEARRHDAERMILGAVEGGSATIHQVYLEVFAPVLREVGRRWQSNELTIAEEHYVSAATQLVMSRLYARIFATERRGLTMIAACAGTEFHEIGLRMVADFFELDGWDTHYLGADVADDAMVRALRERGAHLLALSTTMVEHVPQVRATIAAIRADPAAASVKILVGGSAFRARSELWREIGADGCTSDAVGAVALANELVGAAPRGGRR